ncbi:hypothetical protein VBH57_13190, partial [Enterococcus hirae]
KVRKTEKISSILTINIKIELIFFLRKNYCPTLILLLSFYYPSLSFHYPIFKYFVPTIIFEKRNRHSLLEHFF